jgi:molecular chaperone DnaK
MIHTTEKTLAEHGDKASGDEKEAIENDVKALKEALEGDDVDAIQEKTQALAQSSMKLGEAIYKAEQEAAASEAAASEAGPTDEDGGGPAEGSPSEGDGPVVDADFEEVDDDKKSKSA